MIIRWNRSNKRQTGHYLTPMPMGSAFILAAESVSPTISTGSIITQGLGTPLLITQGYSAAVVRLPLITVTRSASGDRISKKGGVA